MLLTILTALKRNALILYEGLIEVPHCLFFVLYFSVIKFSETLDFHPFISEQSSKNLLSQYPRTRPHDLMSQRENRPLQEDSALLAPPQANTNDLVVSKSPPNN